MIPLLESLVGPNEIRTLVRSVPEYIQSRNRAGAVVHDGLVLKEKYEKARPYIFAGSLLCAAGSAWMLWKRKKVSGEAVALWSAALVASGASAWVTRPAGNETAHEASAPAETKESGGVIGYIDKRVSELAKANPAFADAAIKKLVAMPSIKPKWDGLSPAVKALVI